MINWEHLRLLVISFCSPLLGYLTPTKGFIVALTIAFGFNIFAGLRADGISITCCENFRMRKFLHALTELGVYLVVLLNVFTVLRLCGDEDAAVFAVKSITYICIYVYMCNGLRNLIAAYPLSVALRVVYYIVRFEFTRAMPSHWKPIIERMGKEIDTHKND